MARISIIGGDGRRSGIPRLIQLLCEVFIHDHTLTVISDINRGGFDFLAEKEIGYVQLSGLASGLNPIRILSAFRALRRELISREADVLWVQSSVSVFLARLILIELRWIRKRKVALVAAYQGVPFGPGRNPVIAAPMRLLEYLCLAITPRHVLLFTSQMDCDLIPRMLQNRHSVAHALNCSLVRSAPETIAQATQDIGAKRRIVMTTRVSLQKNLQAAAELFAQLPEAYTLCLVGPDTDGKEIQQDFRTRLTPEKFAAVEFMGTQSDVAPFLLTADLYLMTSRYEGLPFGAIEAFECGLPIALTDVGGTAEIAAVHPLFEQIDVNNAETITMASRRIHAQISQYRQDPAEWRKKIHTAWASQFSLPVWTDSIRACLRTALGNDL